MLGVKRLQGEGCLGGGGLQALGSDMVPATAPHASCQNVQTGTVRYHMVPVTDPSQGHGCIKQHITAPMVRSSRSSTCIMTGHHVSTMLPPHLQSPPCP